MKRKTRSKMLLTRAVARRSHTSTAGAGGFLVRRSAPRLAHPQAPPADPFFVNYPSEKAGVVPDCTVTFGHNFQFTVGITWSWSAGWKSLIFISIDFIFILKTLL